MIKSDPMVRKKRVVPLYFTLKNILHLGFKYIAQNKVVLLIYYVTLVSKYMFISLRRDGYASRLGFFDPLNYSAFRRADIYKLKEKVVAWWVKVAPYLHVRHFWWSSAPVPHQSRVIACSLHCILSSSSQSPVIYNTLLKPHSFSQLTIYNLLRPCALSLIN